MTLPPESCWRGVWCCRQKHVQLSCEGEHLQQHKAPEFNMVTKTFHVSEMLMPEREEVEMEGGEGSVLTFAINLVH